MKKNQNIPLISVKLACLKYIRINWQKKFQLFNWVEFNKFRRIQLNFTGNKQEFKKSKDFERIQQNFKELRTS